MNGWCVGLNLPVPHLCARWVGATPVCGRWCLAHGVRGAADDQLLLQAVAAQTGWLGVVLHHTVALSFRECNRPRAHHSG